MGERIFRLGVALQGDSQQALAANDVIDQFGALGGFDQQWRHHARKDDDVG